MYCEEGSGVTMPGGIVIIEVPTGGDVGSSPVLSVSSPTYPSPTLYPSSTLVAGATVVQDATVGGAGGDVTVV
jgi:hypothetical protein